MLLQGLRLQLGNTFGKLSVLFCWHLLLLLRLLLLRCMLKLPVHLLECWHLCLCNMMVCCLPLFLQEAVEGNVLL